MATPRPTWDQTFMDAARVFARRGTCLRDRVGAVIVSPQHHVIGVGYNGAPPGAPHCLDVGCMMEDGHCTRCLHAEHNAVLNSEGDLRGATVYVTHTPCWRCYNVLAAKQVARIVWAECYRVDPRVIEHARAAGIVLDGPMEACDALG